LDAIPAYLSVDFIRLLFLLPVLVGAQCVNFPANLVPLASVSYVTAADSGGDHLVVGSLAGGLNTLSQLPLPASTNQLFCDAQVQLAPQQYYPGVYVPTAAEQSGNFSAFAGLLVDPTTNLAYPGGIIPSGVLGQVYAFRIAAAQPSQAVKPWIATGSMAYRRQGHAAVLLPTGKVLVVGGEPPGLAPAEIYDPATGTFASTGTPKFLYGFTTAVLLQDGRVLIAGTIGAISSAEVYDPASGQFTSVGATVQPRGRGHTATLLNDGRVLLVGGLNDTESAASGAELFDPTTGTFTQGGPMIQIRWGHTATLLANGRVLIAGGVAGPSTDSVAVSSTEIFDPSNGTFSSTGSMSDYRLFSYATLLPSGKVLIGGGSIVFPPEGADDVYDPSIGTFTVTGSMIAGNRTYAAATLLSNGQVLVEGGIQVTNNSQAAYSSAELYIPASGSFMPAGNMSVGRQLHTSTLLPDGRVLVTGGTLSDLVAAYSSAELYTPVVQGLVTSQTGVTFRAAPNGSPAAQTVQVLSPSDSIPWTLSVKTYSGGNWLTATPSSGNNAPGAATVPVSIKVNTTGLASQDFYGAVTLTPTDGIHAPVSITVVLSIVPVGTAFPMQVSPGGLAFTGASGSSPAAQSFTLANLASNPITFTATATGTWFNLSARSGTVTGAQPVVITITPSSAALVPGVYPGSVTLAFSDSTKQTVALVLVVKPPGSTVNTPARRDATTPSCTPTKLVPVLTSISSGYTVQAAWPAPIIAQIQDDCGSPLNAGNVTASFTNGDAPLPLVSIGAGAWSATWVPSRNYPGATVRIDAQSVAAPVPINGSVQVAVSVGSNPQAPVVFTGGIVSTGDFSSAPALGLLVSIFGSGLADSAQANSSLPLPPQLGSTSVFLSSGEQLPLLYVADGLINVLIPYDAVAKTTQQVVVQRGNSVSVPMPIAIFNAAPAVLSTAGSGLGQGHIYVIGAGGVETLAAESSPAHAGDAVVIYCVGLGPVTPTVSGGAAAPSSPPFATANAVVTVTFGNQTATAAFAGLTPGLAGLYQINVTVPAGVTPGNQVPVTISAGGAASSNPIYMAIQ
jgi:uncharacterized protein (TIGR03437 family)